MHEAAPWPPEQTHPLPGTVGTVLPLCPLVEPATLGAGTWATGEPANPIPWALQGEDRRWDPFNVVPQTASRKAGADGQ